jgi:hypothetical protein
MIKLYILLATWLVVAAIGWYARQQYVAEQRGREIERALIAAKANQNIAERRVTDAKFDKLDARSFCIDSGLEWVFEDGKSFCR